MNAGSGRCYFKLRLRLPCAWLEALKAALSGNILCCAKGSCRLVQLRSDLLFSRAVKAMWIRNLRGVSVLGSHVRKRWRTRLLP
jgi:hypothetical protein